MILADTNFWLALVLSKHLFHTPAIRWFQHQPTSSSILFCRSTQQSFLRLLTTDTLMRVYSIPAMTNSLAWETYQTILANPRCGYTNESGDLSCQWTQYSNRDSASPKLWMDSYLAALAVTSGHQFVTTDVAFRQFEKLDLIVIERA